MSLALNRKMARLSLTAFSVSCSLLFARLVDEIAHKIMVETDEAPTSTSILGPFWSPNAPFRELGGSIIQDMPKDGQIILMQGRVLDFQTQKPLTNAVVDIWQASANGKYDFQDPDNQSDNNLRGKFRTNSEGKYWYYCLRPTAYSLPTDGELYSKGMSFSWCEMLI